MHTRILRNRSHPGTPRSPFQPRRWTAAVCLAMLGVLLVHAADKRRPTIGVSLLTMTNPFFVELGDAIKEEAAKHGMDVILVSGEFDAAKQKNQVSDFLVKRVSAIVLSPCDSKAVGTVIQDANRAGIPVFTADIACIAPEAKVVTHVATDNYGGGKMAATALIEALQGKGKIAIIDFPEVESVMLRTKGFEEELTKRKADSSVQMEIVAKLPGGGVKDKSFKAAEDILQSHPDLKGFFAINDPSALGAIAALEKAGKLDGVKVVGFDGQPEGRKAIRLGKIYADPVQYPRQIGTRTVKAIVDYLAGEDVPAQILIPTGLYRKEDALKDATIQ